MKINNWWIRWLC